MKLCQKGVIWKDSVASFTLHSFQNIYNMMNAVNSGEWESGAPKMFTVTSPKRREIVSVKFKDRVYQRCLNDNVLYPIMTNSFIYDNFACQKKKGTDFARNRLKKFLREAYLKWGDDFYVLQIDIKGYYPNMPHEFVEHLFKRKVDEEYYERVIEILHTQHLRQVGYDAGSQMIQIAGIAAVDHIDHIVKEKLRSEFYGRYMDDSFLISNDFGFLEHCLDEIGKEYSKCGLTLNKKKTKIIHIKDYMSFLGFRFTVTKTGKVLVLIKPENIRRQRRHYKGLARRHGIGAISKEEIDESFKCSMAHLEKGDTWKARKNMEKYYKNLFERSENERSSKKK